MNEELYSVTTKVETRLKSLNSYYSVSAQVGYFQYNTVQKPYIGICSHFFDETTQSIQTFGIDVIPLPESNNSEDLNELDEFIFVKLKKMNINKYQLRYIVNSNAYRKPTFLYVCILNNCFIFLYKWKHISLKMNNYLYICYIIE